MRRRFVRLGSLLTVFLFAGSLLAPAALASDGWATELHYPHQGTVGKGKCAWHFVHTQAPRGSDAITLKVNFSGDRHDGMHVSEKIQAKGKNQHWTIWTYSRRPIVLKNAWTDQTGKLVLCYLTCYKKHRRGY